MMANLFKIVEIQTTNITKFWTYNWRYDFFISRL